MVYHSNSSKIFLFNCKLAYSFAQLDRELATYSYENDE